MNKAGLLTSTFVGALLSMSAASPAYAEESAGVSATPTSQSTTTSFNSAHDEKLLNFGEAVVRAQDLSKNSPAIYVAVSQGLEETFTAEQFFGAVKSELQKHADADNNKIMPHIIPVYAKDPNGIGAATAFSFFINGLEQLRQFDYKDGDGTLDFHQIRENKEAMFDDLILAYRAVFLNEKSEDYIARNTFD